MKVALSTKNFRAICGHAGQCRHWLIYDLTGHVSGAPLPEPQRVELEKAQVIHHFSGEGAHPLDGTSVVLTASAGDGFVRRMQQRGARVCKTGETDPSAAINHVLAGETQPEPDFDITTSLCKVFDLFSKH